MAKETRLCFLSSFIDKEKNELYNRPSYHYGDRLDCRRNGQGQKRDIGCLTCESCCDKKIAAVRGEMLIPVMLMLVRIANKAKGGFL